MGKIKENEITPEAVYMNRRNFIRAGLLAGSAVTTGAIYKVFAPSGGNIKDTAPIQGEIGRSSFATDEKQNTFEEITNYNNFYEFSSSKTGVAEKAARMNLRPWTVEIGGLVHKPTVFDIDGILRFPQEERIYRFRCVEAWSMVIPWVGFPLKLLLDKVEPFGSAKYVAFETLYDPNIMRGSLAAGIDFPYVEGLRLDEAMHPLTILATGLYGKQMPHQNGAPIRLVVPWKYGFKSIKSIVRITLTADEPRTTWSLAAPNEYGFYSNVNPDVDHPRWSQKRERRIGEDWTMRDTLMFNGYDDEVAHLYSGMDLKKYF
ncbi:protein-methionine-sulfoxide reductase catalytic subunit MsrP [Leptolyngbya sp. 7M]|uniref:protein-methionine-sulfoxide reductase catalytic subunit MsrP n=1 Tax=Leptolyngbya sp. 7M TaxID=2812896 RepID=UPI001CECBD81|nr:protein-methionine-sulfoxide reductase catalytic subunit MsrP [Leptolyngbya sp. 7M]